MMQTIRETGWPRPRVVILLLVAGTLAGCWRHGRETTRVSDAAHAPNTSAVASGNTGGTAAQASPEETVNAFVRSFAGDVAVASKPGTVLPVAHQDRAELAFDCSWTDGKLPAGSGTIEVDKERGFVSLAILRWPGAQTQKLTEEQLRANALARLHEWAGADVVDDQVKVQPLNSKTRVAYLWDAREGDHWSGRRAHVVLSNEDGLPVSFAQYVPPATAVAPKVTHDEAVQKATAALSPLPTDFQQTAVEARLYDHSPLAGSEGPVWAVALSGTRGADKQTVEAGAVIDAVSGDVLAPKPKTQQTEGAGHSGQELRTAAAGH